MTPTSRTLTLLRRWGFWHKRGERWTVRRVALRADDLEPVEVTARPRRKGKAMRQAGLFG